MNGESPPEHFLSGSLFLGALCASVVIPLFPSEGHDALEGLLGLVMDVEEQREVLTA